MCQDSTKRTETSDQEPSTSLKNQCAQIIPAIAFHPCFLWTFDLGAERQKKRKTDAIQIYSWHASTILYDRQQDKVIESCQVFFAYRVKHHARNFPPSLDLLIALIMYLSTDAKPRRASLPPALSSWRAFGL